MRKLIIDGANYSTNGIKEQEHVDFTIENGKASGTEQGMILFGSSYTSRNHLSRTSSTTYNNYVKSNKAIYLYPGDTLVVMTPQSPMTFMCIYGYREPVTDMTNWPSYTAGTSDKFVTKSSGSSHYQPYKYVESSVFPLVLKNTHTSQNLCIIIQGRKSSGTLTPLEAQYIEYRIYTDNPEAYDEEETEE